MYENSNKIFVGRFENKTSKAGNEYMVFSLSPEDFEKIDKAKNEKGWANFMVGKSQKTGLPYLSYTPREGVTVEQAQKIFDGDTPF